MILTLNSQGLTLPTLPWLLSTLQLPPNLIFEVTVVYYIIGSILLQNLKALPKALHYEECILFLLFPLK